MKQNSPKDKAQIVYFSHGGGPLPVLGDASHKAMVDFMLQLPCQIRKPDAILVISAHWEESDATLLGALTTPMFYDYYGFPDEAYETKQPSTYSRGLFSNMQHCRFFNLISSLCLSFSAIIVGDGAKALVGDYSC
jgi:aromatic ring-opening dioxygenase catalytic subunit (LigB family)